MLLNCTITSLNLRRRKEGAWFLSIMVLLLKGKIVVRVC
nr:MAG TPA: hypothetical protein [Crassvirales sp.]